MHVLAAAQRRRTGAARTVTAVAAAQPAFAIGNAQALAFRSAGRGRAALPARAAAAVVAAQLVAALGQAPAFTVGRARALPLALAARASAAVVTADPARARLRAAGRCALERRGRTEQARVGHASVGHARVDQRRSECAADGSIERAAAWRCRRDVPVRYTRRIARLPRRLAASSEHHCQASA